MDLEAIRACCLSKPQAQETYPFGQWPICFKIGGKIFAQIYPDKITLKCTRFAGERFRQQYPGIVVRGYHCPPVQQPYWNTIYYDGFPKEDLPYLIDLAYDTVLSGFSRKKREELLGQPKIAP